MSRAKLGIIIPTHHRADLLRHCLESVTLHSPEGTEILVVVDGSDHRSTFERLSAVFHSVHFHFLEQSKGFCGAVNAGLAHMDCEIVELLNDDTEVKDDWTHHALAAFDSPEVGAVAPLVLLAGDSESLVDSAGDGYHLGGFAYKRGHGKPVTNRLLVPHEVFGASGSSAFYRMEVLKRVGGFPNEFGAYFDDVDVAFRLRWAGYRILYEPRSKVVHHTMASHGRPAGSLLEMQSLNEERVFWRNMPLALMPLALPCHLAVLAGKLARRIREGNHAGFLKGKMRITRELGSILSYRVRCGSHAWRVASGLTYGFERLGVPVP